jgi:hypothetical protein
LAQPSHSVGHGGPVATLLVAAAGVAANWPECLAMAGRLGHCGRVLPCLSAASTGVAMTQDARRSAAMGVAAVAAVCAMVVTGAGVAAAVSGGTWGYRAGGARHRRPQPRLCAGLVGVVRLGGQLRRSRVVHRQLRTHAGVRRQRDLATDLSQAKQVRGPLNDQAPALANRGGVGPFFTAPSLGIRRPITLVSSGSVGLLEFRGGAVTLPERSGRSVALRGGSAASGRAAT